MPVYKVVLNGRVLQKHEPDTYADIVAETPEMAAKLYLLKIYNDGAHDAAFVGDFPCLVVSASGEQTRITVSINWLPVITDNITNDNSITVHELKTLPKFFDAVEQLSKKAELRLNDRDFHVGDYVKLIRLDGSALPRTITCQITHIVHGGQYGLASDFCMLSLAVIAEIQS